MKEQDFLNTFIGDDNKTTKHCRNGLYICTSVQLNVFEQWEEVEKPTTDWTGDFLSASQHVENISFFYLNSILIYKSTNQLKSSKP